MSDFVRLHIWLPGTRPDHDPDSLVINTPEALEFVLQALYKDRDIYEGAQFHTVAKQGEEVVGSGQYSIGNKLIVLHEDNLQMSQWWNAANGLTSRKT